MDVRPARWAVYLTPRGIAVLAAAPTLYLLGELFGFAFARALGGVAAAVLVVAVPWVLHRPRVDVRREVYPDRVERDQPSMARLEVRNRSGRWQPPFTAKDVLDDVYREVQVRGLASHATATYRYPLRTARRGRFAVGPLVLERADPLGLVRSVLVTGSSAHVWVYPRRHRVRIAGLAGPRFHYDGERSRKPPAGTTELRQIREYVPGDETRHIHWKAVARAGTLMVREYTDPSEPRLTVVLDNRRDALTATAFEEAVEVVASFACAGLEAQYRTCVATTRGDLRFETNAGRAGARDILDRLAEIGQGAGAAAVPSFERGSVVFVGGAGHDVLATLGVERCAVTAFDLRGVGESWRASPGVAVIAAGTALAAVGQWNAAADRW